MTMYGCEKVWLEVFLEAGLENVLGGLENKYPTIPAIEVTIPHFNASVKYHVP